MYKKEEFQLQKSSGGMAFMLAILIPNIIGALVLTVIAMILSPINREPVSVIMATDSMLFTSLIITQLLMASVILFVCKGGKNAVRVSRFSSPKSWRHTIVTVLLFVGVFFGLSITASLFMEFLGIFGYAPTPSPFPTLDTFPKYLFAIFAIAILPAIIEEIIFRGIILNSLMPYGKWVAIIFSGFLFMLIHASPMQTVYQFILGMILALVVVKTGNIFYAMLIHFLNNFTSITIEYFQIFATEADFPVFLVAGAIVLVVATLVVFFKESDAIVKKDETCFNELVLSENDRLNKILLSQEKAKRNGDKMIMIISYGIGIAVCVAFWIVQFVAGLQ